MPLERTCSHLTERDAPRSLVRLAACIAALALAVTGGAVDAQFALGEETKRSELIEFTERLREFVALPNNADDREALERNTVWLVRELGARGFETTDLSDDDYALLFAELGPKDAERTLLFYFHYDGQPVDPSQWNQTDPYESVLKSSEGPGNWKTHDWSELDDVLDAELRLFGRSTSDAKGPIVMMLQALDRLRRKGQEPVSRIKLILDGKEEQGSPGLPERIRSHLELLAADALIVFDGPQDPSNRPTIYYGCRGLARATITTFGPILPQHSGHFGNVAPNPAFELAHLLASMKDESGRVLIEGFYEGVEQTPAERALIERLPSRVEELQERFQLARLDAVAETYHEALQYPSLNVRRLSSPLFSGLRTIVPDRARADLDIRLVPETDGARQLDLLKKHLEDLGYTVLARRPDLDLQRTRQKFVQLEGNSGVPAFQTPPDAEIADFLRAAVVSATGSSAVEIPLMGGTVPITPFIEALRIPAVVAPMANNDNNQHSPNENLRLGNAAIGIEVFEAIFLQR